MNFWLYQKVYHIDRIMIRSDLLIIKLWLNFLDHTRAISTNRSIDYANIDRIFLHKFFMTRHKLRPTHVLHTHQKSWPNKFAFMIQIFPHVLTRCRSTRQPHRLNPGLQKLKLVRHSEFKFPRPCDPHSVAIRGPVHFWIFGPTVSALPRPCPRARFLITRLHPSGTRPRGLLHVVVLF